MGLLSTFLCQFSGPVGYQKVARAHELASARKSPWATSLDSVLAPSSSLPCSPISERPGTVPTSQFLSMASTSLFESTPFNTNSGPGARQAERRATGGRSPLDLGNFGVSAVGSRNQFGQGAASLWDNGQSRNEKKHSQGSSDNLFSTDTAFPEKPARGANNWVNFLDAGGANALATQPANKTVSEIWDSGKSPSSTDGWALYESTLQSSAGQGNPIDTEADAVDALFYQPPTPTPWAAPRAASPTQSTFGGQELPWNTPVWSGGPPSSEGLPVSPSATFAFSVPSQQGAESIPTHGPQVSSAFGPLGGSGIWNHTGPWSTCKD